MCMIDLHCHTDYSNIRLLDAITTVESLIQGAADMGKLGVAITEHESISSHMKAIQITRRLKEEEKIPQNFKLVLGNEIYLVDSLEEVRDNYEGGGKTKFPHFLLLAKDKESHEALRILSSRSWSESFFTGLMERVPTTKEHLIEVVKQFPDKLIASSACLGSESSIHILNNDYDKAREFLQWCSNLFGKGNFYLELQPSKSDEQRKVNEWLIKFSKELNLDLIITSDVHYLRPEDAGVHEAYLNAKNGDREIASFYESCYLHTESETYEKLDYLDESIVKQAMLNTIKIGSMIEEYTLEAPTIIPRVDLPVFQVKHLFKQGYNQYSYIEKMANSNDEQDQYLIHLIEDGFMKLLHRPDMTRDEFHEILARIDIELSELWEISMELNQAMSSYYVTIQELIKIFWADDCGEDSRDIGSIVGSGRGSASGFLINYILGITGINPLSYGVEMPHWRHLHKSRGDIGALDIDVDVRPESRATIFKRMKDRFSEDRVLQVCTFGTEGSKSAIQTACRGLGYDLEIGQHISSLIPFERGENYSIKDCLEGNPEKGRSPVKEFIREISKLPKLQEVSLKIEGLVNKRSIHAGGVILTNESYIKSGNAMMRAPNGTHITQLNLDDTQAAGAIKYDILGVSNISKLQASLEIMLDEGLVEWHGNLRDTFNKYFHPDNLDLNNPRYYELLGEGEIPDLFQFDTALANQALITAKPSNLIEMAAVNSLMRLMGDGNETPVETFTKFKNDISLWYEEMNEYNLNESEVRLMESYLLPISGIAETQEVAMLLSMDENIAGLDVQGANRLRKAIAKKSEKAYEKIEKEFYESGLKRGTRIELLDYVWKVQIGRQKGYSFSILHTIAYSIIGLQNISVVEDYSPIIWHTACLTINSGSTEVEEGTKAKNSDYGKVSTALGNLQSYGVKVELPLINTAGFGFTPDIKGNRIIFSLKGINGIGDDVVHSIIANRPYKSFEDFHERMYQTKLVTKGQALQLIRAGCFNEFNTQIEIMKQFLVKEVDVKTTLNGQNLQRIINLGLFNTPEYQQYRDYYNFRKRLIKKVHQNLTSPKNRILLLENEDDKSYFWQTFDNDSITGYHGNHLLIDEKEFTKDYDAKMLPTKELLSDVEFVRLYNNAQFLYLWHEVASNSVEAWQMESVGFFADKHQLDYADQGRYGIVDFNSLSETPVVLSENTAKNGRVYKNLELSTIAGVVLDKNKNSNSFTLLTTTGVIACKLFSGSFSHYDRQIKSNGQTERSWLGRGSVLLVSGYRRNDTFVLKANYGEHTINKITEIRNDGTLALQSDRIRAN